MKNKLLYGGGVVFLLWAIYVTITLQMLPETSHASFTFNKNSSDSYSCTNELAQPTSNVYDAGYQDLTYVWTRKSAVNCPASYFLSEIRLAPHSGVAGIGVFIKCCRVGH